MCKVEINGKIITVSEGTLLSDVLMMSGNGANHLCGGRGVCKKCLVKVNGVDELACRYTIKSDILVETIGEREIVSESGASESRRLTENLCLVLDLGTTTLALALVSLDEKSIVRVVTKNNPQRTFGADIMSRIDYCRHNGVDALNSSVIKAVNSMIAELGVENLDLFVAGNATMLHLFFAVDCSSIGVAPYTPVFLESRSVRGETLSLNAANVIALPSIHSFVGADIVAGMNFIGFPQKGKHNLLVDLGTNAEIVLFDEHTAVCTSAAAGPCFEGANISCGMSASDGAVYSYINSVVKTIGNLPAKGICGTGLVDVVAELVGNGTVDETGFMGCDSFEIADGVEITQADIREYQLAKSAVNSAIHTLLEKKKITFDDVGTMYISGGFSAKINVENAVCTGLLPVELKEKCVAVNNSSLLGAVKHVCEGNDLTEFTKIAEYADLSADATFSQLFIENMMF